MSKSIQDRLAKSSNDIETGNYTKFRKKLPFTPKEGLVFYGLIKFPGLTDQKLSKKLKIKRPTITAIRNKLKRQNFYSPFAIPNFELLGYELMTFIWGKSSSLSLTLEEKMKIPAIKKAMQLPENVFQIATDNEFFAFLLFKNFTEFKKIEDEYAQVYKNHSSEEQNVHIVHFPFETSELLSLFDYSSLFKKLLKLGFEERMTKPTQKAAKPKPLIELKESEKIVLGALIKYPELNDTEIAKKNNITRQTVSKIKSKLIKQGAIKLINEPNFKKIGCELFVNMHVKFNPRANPNKRGVLLENLEKNCMILDIASHTEEACVGLFEDYLSFKIIQDELEKAYKANDLLLREPIIQISPIPQIKFQKTDFASITEKALNIKIP